MKKSGNIKLGKLLFGLLCLAVGIFLAVHALTIRRQSQESSSWPIAQGKVVHSQLKTVEKQAEKRRNYTTYLPHVQYRYRVAEKEYESDRLEIWIRVKAAAPKPNRLLKIILPGRSFQSTITQKIRKFPFFTLMDKPLCGLNCSLR